MQAISDALKPLVGRWEARMGEPVVSIEIYTQDATSGDIQSRNVDNRGQVSDYRAAMEDGVWKVNGDAESFTSTSLTANRIEGLWRLKTDQGWVDWMTVRLDRVG